MSSTIKPITDSTNDELIERRKKHQFIINLIDDELNKRKALKRVSSTPNIDKPDEPAKKKSINDSTKDDIKAVLTANNIEWKSSMKKDDLIALVKKNNLVRACEEFTLKKKK